MGVGHVAAVLSESFGSKLVPYVQQLPVQAKVLLCVLLSTHQPSVPEKEVRCCAAFSNDCSVDTLAQTLRLNLSLSLILALTPSRIVLFAPRPTANATP